MYEQAMQKLVENHFYPSAEVEVGVRSEKVTGISIYSPPLLMDSRVDRLKEILGEEYDIQKLPNSDKIVITKKKSDE